MTTLSHHELGAPQADVPLQVERPVNPEVSNKLFDVCPEAAYWVGIIAVEGKVVNEELYNAAGELRSRIFIKEHGILPEEAADENGREFDEYDDRSVHFAIVARSKSQNKARLMGVGRAILKKTETDVLPIQEVFSEIFEETPLKVPAVEISRYMCYDENKMRQHAGAVALIRAMAYGTLDQGIDRAYFEIEAPLLHLLGEDEGIGLPLERIGEPKKVVEPGGVRELYPIAIKPSEITTSIPNAEESKFTLREFFESEAPTSGLGYYPITLVGGKEF